MDFSLKAYKQFLLTLKNAGYSFQTFEEYLDKPENKVVILRHDIDKLPKNALKMAYIEFDIEISASYYFRVTKKVWNESIMKEIVKLNHELAYHYEDMSLCKGNQEKAIKHFEFHLNNFRKLYPSKTICMHGSPLADWDNRVLWDTYDYRDYGIIGEPYFDIDFSETAYYTDTGRMWDGQRFSVRDKVDKMRKNYPSYHTTRQMIQAIDEGTFPERAMITFHPQRWTNKPIPWLKELVWQKTKNVVKYFLIRNEG